MLQDSFSPKTVLAWSPQNYQWLASGSSKSNVLEILQLDSNQAPHTLTTESSFNTLAWGAISHQNPHGILATGKEKGRLELWNPTAIVHPSEDPSLVMSNQAHSTQINSLDFNPFQANLLSSAGSHSEIYIWDLHHPQTPYAPGARSSRMDTVHAVAWNGQVQHILASASNNGYTVIWDLRSKKEILTLPKNPQAVRAMAWHPFSGTQIMIASEDATISLWDLRHTQVAENTLKGHSGAVVDIAWCRQDPNFLLSAGKDGSVLCWNPNSGKCYGEITRYNTSACQVLWCPSQPQRMASASLDAPIQTHSIYSLAMATPPQWLRRPIGSTLAPKGKWVTFRNRRVQVRTLGTDSDILKRSEQLESATSDQGSMEAFIEDRIRLSDKEDWKVLRALFSNNARKELIRYLGFEKAQVMAALQSLQTVHPPTLSALFPTPPRPHSFFSPSPLLESGSAVDRSITDALILGDFEGAVDLCLTLDRLSDALLIGACGGPALLKRVQTLYIDRHGPSHSYLYLLHHLLDRDLASIVQHASLAHWQSVLAILCTFATPTELASLAEHLGDRLAASGERKEAIACYLSSGQLAKVSQLWWLQLSEKTRDDAQLQELVEKITLFRKAIHYQDHDLITTAGPFTLHSLYQTYCLYAQMMASQGESTVALKYMQLVPVHFPGRDTLLASLRSTSYHTAPQ
ncbi:WD40-repeat-containing domain protein [Sporodiniella umbellata]|nr:WD40-repeat-containing domain protein [Sporodiniella umbellata]